MKHILLALLFLPIYLQAQTVHISVPSDTVCAGTPAHFKAAITAISAPHFRWSVNNSAAGTDSSGFTTSSLADNDTVRCLLVNNIGDTVFAASNDVVMTVQHMPVVSPIFGPDSIVCVGSMIALSDSSAGGVWSESNGQARVLNGIITGVLATYYPPDTIIYILANSCGIDTAKKTITILQKPNASFSVSSSVCVGGSVQFYNPNSNTALVSSHGLVNITFCFPNSDYTCIYGRKKGVDYIYNSVQNQCGSDSFGMNMTVNDIPTRLKIIAPDEICSGASLKLTDSTDGFSSSWTSKNNRATISGTGVIKGIDPGLDTIIVSAFNGCGPLSRSTTINILPPGHIIGFDSVCLGASIAFSDATKGGTWATEDPVIANIDQAGVVTGNKTGSTYITYKYGVCTTSRQVRVNVPLDSITGENTICNGGKLTWMPPVKKGIWRSGDTLIARVDTSGQIVGDAPGTATITYQLSGCLATKNISVEQRKLISGDPNICVNSETTLSGINNGEWTSKENVVEVSLNLGTVKGLSQGFANIIYTQVSGCRDTFLIEVTDCNDKFSLFPNPAKDEINIWVDLNLIYSFSILNSMAQVIMNQHTDQEFNRVHIGALPPGIYLVFFYGYSHTYYTAKFFKY